MQAALRKPHRADSPRLSPAALGLVVLAHMGALLALASLRTAPLEIPDTTLMVELLQPQAEAPQPPEVKPLKPVATTPKPQPVAPAQPLPPAATPVLATESPAAPAASEVSKAEKAPATPAPPAAPQAAAAPARNVAAAEPSTPRFDADYLQNPAPAYPPLSKRAGEEGRVVLKVYVEASGLASKVDIHKSSGSERLDRSAMAAVSRWKFVPAKLGTEAVAAWVLVPIVFSLKD
ncbi:MAG: energy transducer TonB [Rhodoferax sp.]|nr:energy transducer TonB [Rhodoferax sp.]